MVCEHMMCLYMCVHVVSLCASVYMHVWCMAVCGMVWIVSLCACLCLCIKCVCEYVCGVSMLCIHVDVCVLICEYGCTSGYVYVVSVASFCACV